MSSALKYVLLGVFLLVLAATAFLGYQYMTLSGGNKTSDLNSLPKLFNISGQNTSATPKPATSGNEFLEINSEIPGYSVGIGSNASLNEIYVSWGVKDVNGVSNQYSFKPNKIQLNLVSELLTGNKKEGEYNTVEYGQISWVNPNGQSAPISQYKIDSDLAAGILKINLFVDPVWLGSPTDVFTGTLRQGNQLQGDNLKNYMINYQFMTALFMSSTKNVKELINPGSHADYIQKEFSDKIESFEKSGYPLTLQKP